MKNTSSKRLVRAGARASLSLLALLSGCSSDAVPPGSAAGASSAGASSAGAFSAGGAAGSPGNPASGSAGVNAGGAAPSAGSSGAAEGGRVEAGGNGNGGASGGQGGGGGSTIGGAPSGGSAGNSAGSGGAANAGSGGAADDSAAAAVLNRYQLLDPCDLSNYKVESAAGAVCPQTTAVKNQHISLQFGGDAAVTYQVTLRVRAIMEHYWYAGGTLDPVSKTFYTGGVPTVGGYTSACKNKTSELPFSLPTELRPTDDCFNGFNVFAMAVSAPKTHYYLNYTTDKSSDRPPHAVYTDDYTVTIPIQGQAKLDFYIIGSDEHQCYNHKTVVSGVTLSSSPYIGQFVQFDVVKVARVP